MSIPPKCQAIIKGANRQCDRYVKYEVDGKQLCHAHAAELVFKTAKSRGDVREIPPRYAPLTFTLRPEGT